MNPVNFPRSYCFLVAWHHFTNSRNFGKNSPSAEESSNEWLKVGAGGRLPAGHCNLTLTLNTSQSANNLPDFISLFYQTITVQAEILRKRFLEKSEQKVIVEVKCGMIHT